MAPKHGRQVSHSAEEAARLRRQVLAIARVRRQRERQAQASLEQLEQGEAILQFSAFGDAVAPTLPQLGLRVQGLTLPQDVNYIQDQAGTVPVQEHAQLYPRNNSDTTAPSRSIDVRPQTAHPSDLSRFFCALPILNPIPVSHNRQPVRAAPLQHWPPDSAPSSSLRCQLLSNIPPQGSEDEIYTDDGVEDRGGDDSNGGFCTNVDTGENEIPDTVTSPLPTIPARVIEDSDEESDFPLASEHSVSGEADGDEQSDEVSQVADKLMDVLLNGIQGCTEEEHLTQFQAHMEVHGNDHHGLDDIFNDGSFPSVLGSSTLLTGERLAQMPPTAPVQWRAMYCGVTSESQHGQPLQVCLHKEETQATESQVAFDVDSFLGFTTSLGFMRKGFWYQPAPQMRQNMSSNVHITTTITEDGPVGGEGLEEGDRPVPRATAAMLRDVPHFLLGRVEGAHDITVHVLFPHLGIHGDKFHALTTEQFTRWFDRVFHPAVYKHCAAHFSQHLPASFRQAFANSKARQVEGRMIETSSYQAQQVLGYHLQPHHLGPIWDDVVDTSAHFMGVQDFREPQLFFSAKGTKLMFKSTPVQPSLLDVMHHFQMYLADIIDMNFVDEDRFFADVGKEVCPSVSVLASQSLAFDEQPQTYLWKQCCQEQHARHVYDNLPPKKGGRGQYYYTQNMLGDAGSLTSVPPKRSLLYRGGIRYFQLYGSVKEVWDAAKSMPFDNDGLEEMALDPQIRQGARQLQGGRARDSQIVERAYAASKRRAHQALRDSAQKSFGIREEYRISWRLFCRLQVQLEQLPATELVTALVDCPPYAWAIKTDTFLSFLWRSADKFATGFEVVRAQAQHNLVTWEQTKMMAMFLRCLRFVLGGHSLERESALWWSRRDLVVSEERRIWYGLGFCNTLPRYGYCWLEPRFDWTRLVFLSAVTDRVLFGNNMLRGRYLRRGGQVQDFFHLTRRLELALEWLYQHQEHHTIRDRMIYWIVHICLQQFRVDIMTSVRSEIHATARDEAVTGHEPFSYDYFQEIMSGGVYLSSGNRCDFKVPSLLGHYLFDYGEGDDWRRDHWENRPFRKMFQRASTAIGTQFGTQSNTFRAFRRRFWRSLYAHHWLLPHPAGGVLLQTTKQGHRMWYSIRTGKVNATDRPEPHHWEWARKDWQSGRPAALPEYLGWERDAWEYWIREQCRRRPETRGAPSSTTVA